MQVLDRGSVADPKRVRTRYRPVTHILEFVIPKSVSSQWLDLGLDAWSLGIEASAVMAMRVAKLAAGGPAATKETKLMVSEKITAGLDLQVAFLTGSLGTSPLTGSRKTVGMLRRKVAANRRRLTKR